MTTNRAESPATPSAPSPATSWQAIHEFIGALLHPSMSQRILTPQFLSIIYVLLIITVAVIGLYAVVLAFIQSWWWGLVSLLFYPVALLTAVAVVRIIFEVLSLFADLVGDIKNITAMQSSIERIGTMAKPVAEIGGSVSEMSTDIKTIAQMYSSIYKISSVTENLDTIAGMYPAIQKLAGITDHVEDISNMRHTIELLPQLAEHIQIIAGMRPSIDKLAELTDNIEIIAEMRDSIDKISEIGEVVSKLRRAPFMRP